VGFVPLGETFVLVRVTNGSESRRVADRKTET
jgi:hypothetical protein